MKFPSLFLGSLALAISAATAPAQSTYNGNTGTGFGGEIGNGSLTISANTTANTFTFTLNPAYNNPSTDGFGNNFILYIDSVPNAGFTSTAGFTDNGDAGREAISGYNASNSSRTLATFPSTFGADYAIDFEPTYAGVFQLVNGGSFIAGPGTQQPNTPGEILTLTIPASALGLTVAQGFTLAGTLISPTAYRSNEILGGTGAVAVDPTNPGTAPNAGFTGSVNFSGVDTFGVPAVGTPEPGTYVWMGFGAVVLLVMTARRSRRA